MARKPTLALMDEGSARAISSGAHGDPFSVLGIQDRGGRLVLAAFVPGADTLVALFGAAEVPLAAVAGHPGLFAAEVAARAPYRLRASNPGASWEFDDPFRFGPVIGELDEYLLGEGRQKRLWHTLGAHPIRHEGVDAPISRFGPQCRTRLGGRRFQHLGWSAASDAAARRHRRVGNLCARHG